MRQTRYRIEFTVADAAGIHEVGVDMPQRDAISLRMDGLKVTAGERVYLVTRWLLSAILWLAWNSTTLPAADRVVDPDLRRPADDRPRHDDAKLRELGIRRFESRRLLLYSDIDPNVAKTLPALIDAVYPEWVDYFGPLPPAEDGSEFQLTGYLMRDRGLFLDSGLLPEELVDFQHGKHRRYEFWMAEQQYDYYRRHLLLHEATHCFMTIVPRPSRQPLFYQEGMAELFGSHTTDDTGRIVFRHIAADPQHAIGFGRIEMVQQEVAAGRAKSLDAVIKLSAQDFTSRSIPYAWSWAACQFLDTHPRYRDRFRQLAPLSDGEAFRDALGRLYAADRWRLTTEWKLFTHSIQYGYDIEAAAIDWPEVESQATAEPAAVVVDARRGWQCSGMMVERGQRVRIVASGEITLADTPKPWVSQPQGITIRYANGQPLGRLLATVLPTKGDAATDPTLPATIPVSRDVEFVAEEAGWLALRINDSWNQLRDNRGEYRVSVSVLP
ncbi:MAG: hypothetical protein ACK5Q5_01595 [Planctomycetaceae bacterium]